MKRFITRCFWLLLPLLAACGPVLSAEEQQATFDSSINATVQAEVVERLVTETVAQLSATATFTATFTPTPTATLTPTPTGPIAILEEDVSCYSGPGPSYIELATFEKDLVLAVQFISTNDDFIGVQMPQSEQSCWLALDQVDLRSKGAEFGLATIPPTPTPSLTPTPNIVWRGDWDIWVGPEPLTLYQLEITHEGLQISGSFNAGSGNVVTLNGTLSDDYSQARGIWVSSSGGSGTFYWERKTNPDQFIGNQNGGDTAWCGARAGASIPSPCLAP